jgi:hypothetical protein
LRQNGVFSVLSPTEEREKVGWVGYDSHVALVKNTRDATGNSFVAKVRGENGPCCMDIVSWSLHGELCWIQTFLGATEVCHVPCCLLCGTVSWTAVGTNVCIACQSDFFSAVTLLVNANNSRCSEDVCPCISLTVTLSTEARCNKRQH